MNVTVITNAQAQRVTSRFTSETTALTLRGRRQTQSLGEIMRSEGIDTSVAAISEHDSTRLTAEALGVVTFKVYDLLNEEDLGLGISGHDKLKLLMKATIPSAVQERVERILADPPGETIWIADRFIVAGLTLALGLASYDSVPAFSERRIMEI